MNEINTPVYHAEYRYADTGFPGEKYYCLIPARNVREAMVKSKNLENRVDDHQGLYFWLMKEIISLQIINSQQPFL